MEQQTISIAKAGIQATLNARTSILAAANPVGGRYNRKTTLRANINMSAPIMSRFDLFFVILDECNESVDRHLAEHIVNIHRLRDAAVTPEFTTEQLQRYIRFARTFKPEFTAEAKALLVQKYTELRAEDAQGGIGRNSYRITVRQLESLIRLSEGIAKANCVEDVTAGFVREAFHLLRQSIISVEKDDVEVEDEEEEGGEEMGEGGVVAEGDGAVGRDGDGDGDGDSPMGGQGLDHEGGEDGVDGRAGGGRGPSQTPGAVVGRKTKITYDKYMAILNLLVRRVNEDEQTSGEGVEHEELVLWYLEQKEEELNSQEDLEKEKELVAKVLRRMVKVCVVVRGGRGQSLGFVGFELTRRIRIIFSCRYGGTGLWVRRPREVRGKWRRWFMCCIRTARLRRSSAGVGRGGVMAVNGEGCLQRSTMWRSQGVTASTCRIHDTKNYKHVMFVYSSHQTPHPSSHHAPPGHPLPHQTIHPSKSPHQPARPPATAPQQQEQNLAAQPTLPTRLLGGLGTLLEAAAAGFAAFGCDFAL